MSVFDSESPTKGLEIERDRAKIQAETATYRAETAEREAVVKQLKREYGRDWKKVLGVGGGTDTHTLRSFLSGAKQGMAKATRVPPTLRSQLWGGK